MYLWLEKYVDEFKQISMKVIDSNMSKPERIHTHSSKASKKILRH